MPALTTPEAAKKIRHEDAGAIEFAPGNMTVYRIMWVHDRDREELWVAVIGSGAYIMPMFELHESYVAEKLRMPLGDAIAITRLLNAVCAP